MSIKQEKTSEQQPPALISNSKLQQLYTTMLKCRILDSYARKLEGKSFWKGKEAALAGAAIDLQPDDAIVFSSGIVIGNFLKGLPLRSLFAQFSKRNAKNSSQKQKRAGAPAQSSLATGIAYGRTTPNSKSITVAFLSENPENSAAGQDALLVAAARKLPIVYICGDGSMDASRMYTYNFPVIPVDGNDVVAVYRVAYECTVRAREGGGPSVIVCRFSTSNEEPRRKRDPLRLMEEYLSAKGLFQAEKKQISIRAFEKEITKAKAAPKASPDSETKHNAENIFFL